MDKSMKGLLVVSFIAIAMGFYIASHYNEKQTNSHTNHYAKYKISQIFIRSHSVKW